MKEVIFHRLISISFKSFSLIFGIIFFLVNSNLKSEWIDVSPKSLNLKETIYDISFIDSDTSYAVGWSSSRSIILKTTDGGMNWNLKEFVGFYLFSVEATNSKIFVVGYSARCMCGVLFYSTDHGENWDFYEFDGENKPLTYGAMKIRKDHNGLYFVTGFNGFINYSVDDCESWLYSDTDNNTEIFRDIKFIDNDYYLALTGKNSSVSDKIYISKDAGRKWELLADFSEQQILISGVHFFNPKAGFVFGIKNAKESILQTTDGGKIWTDVFEGEIGNMFTDGLFLDNKIGFAAKRKGMILQTTDGGNNWFPVQFKSNNDIRGFRFFAEGGLQNVYAFGNNGTILKFSKVTAVEQTLKDVILSPNTSDSNLKLELDESLKFIKAEIFNLLGQKIMEITESKENNFLNIENLPKGLYLLLLHRTNGGLISLKFQKK